MEMEMQLNSNFMDIDNDTLVTIDGGVNWDRVYAGAAVYGGATLAVASMSNPIGWGVAGTYLAISAASGAYMGYGFGS